MGVSERLYECACEARDTETRLDRLVRDLHVKEMELNDANRCLSTFRRVSKELVDLMQTNEDTDPKLRQLLSDLKLLSS